jgi:hypothetical protein
VIYDKVSNPGNFGVSNNSITWAFRSFVYYDVAQTNQVSVKLGREVPFSTIQIA